MRPHCSKRARGPTHAPSLQRPQQAATERAALLHHTPQGIFKASLACYTDRGGWGILLLLYSVLLSHGLGNVRADMDEPSNALMGMHGYCTQELVNLLITGPSPVMASLIE